MFDARADDVEDGDFCIPASCVTFGCPFLISASLPVSLLLSAQLVGEIHAGFNRIDVLNLENGRTRAEALH